MTTIPLTQGKEAVVDDDWAHLLGLRWFFTHGYAARWEGKNMVYMHRLIMGEPEGIVDHKNRDSLDNRVENLRRATRSENARNRGATRVSKSGVKAVYWDTPRKKWIVRVRWDGRYLSLGRFDDLAKARKVRDEFVLKHHGEFACLD